MAINKKSTFVVQSLWNFVKMFLSWVLYVPVISARLDQNCRFFINSQVLGLSTFFYPRFRGKFAILTVEFSILFVCITFFQIYLFNCHIIKYWYSMQGSTFAWLEDLSFLSLEFRLDKSVKSTARKLSMK